MSSHILQPRFPEHVPEVRHNDFSSRWIVGTVAARESAPFGKRDSIRSIVKTAPLIATQSKQAWLPPFRGFFFDLPASSSTNEGQPRAIRCDNVEAVIVRQISGPAFSFRK